MSPENVVPFRGRPEKFGKDDQVRFVQFHGSPSKSYLKYIESQHPLAGAEFRKIHEQAQRTISRTFASEIHRNGECVGYVVNHWHQHPRREGDEWHRDYETHHFFDRHGNKLDFKPVPLSSLGDAS